MKLFFALLIVVLPALSAAHSWIVCTDYLENNGWYWDQAKCRGWPRSAERFNMRYGKFGFARGYTHRLDEHLHPEIKPLCRTPRNDTEYSSVTPMAAYYLGQKVGLTHPTNNHVEDSRCKTKPQRDTQNVILVVDGDEDPCCINSTKLIQIFDMGVSPFGDDVPDEVLSTYPKPGFQNAPKFCEDPGNAMATYNFTIPMDMQPGRHTFVWKWTRTPDATNPFTTCWEADVFATKAERDAHYLATGRNVLDMWDFYQVNNIVDEVIVDPMDPLDQIITG